jgi:type III secretory pathway lipoprotein EscJ
MKKIMLLFLLCAVGCRQELARDVSPRDANRIVSLLADIGIAVVQEQQGASQVKLTVAEENQVIARKIISQYRLLPEQHNAEESNEGFFPSADMQKRKGDQALVRKIEDTLKSFAGVLDVRLFFHTPEGTGVSPSFTDKALAPVGSASVVLLCARSCNVKQGEVQKLIAGARGIPSDRVEVIMKHEDFGAILSQSMTPREQSQPTTPIPWHNIMAQYDLLLAGAVALVGVVVMLKSRILRGDHESRA